MSEHSYDSLLSEYQRLLVENTVLLKKLQYFEIARNIHQGDRAERYIASIIHGTLMPKSHMFDILSNTGIRIEVKYASLTIPNKANATSKRWSWGSPFGRNGNKVYDRLLLIGESDTSCDKYIDNNSPFVLFDVPYSCVSSICSVTDNPDNMVIQLGANPDRVKSDKMIRMFSEFQLTEDDLMVRYGIV